jgi:hypothetical protein
LGQSRLFIQLKLKLKGNAKKNSMLRNSVSA